jgi:AMMECR1 domain-containing protein
VRQLQNRFDLLGKEIESAEVAIQAASEGGRFSEVQKLVAAKESLEAQQLSLLEQIEDVSG